MLPDKVAPIAELLLILCMVPYVLLQMMCLISLLLNDVPVSLLLDDVISSHIMESGRFFFCLPLFLNDVKPV